MGELSGVPEWALYSFSADDSVEVGLSTLIEWDKESGNFNIDKEVVVYWPERPKKVSRRNSKHSAMVLLFHESKKYLRSLADELARGEISEEDVIKLRPASNPSHAPNLTDDNHHTDAAVASDKTSRKRTPSSKVLANLQCDVKDKPGKQKKGKKSSTNRGKENQKRANQELLEKIREAELSEWEKSIQFDSVIEDVRECDKSDTSGASPNDVELPGPSLSASVIGVPPIENVLQKDQPGQSQSGLRPSESGKETPTLKLKQSLPQMASETGARPKEDREIKRRKIPVEAGGSGQNEDPKDHEIQSLRKKLKYYEEKIQWYEDVSEMKHLVNEIRYLKSTVASLHGSSPANSNHHRVSFGLHTNPLQMGNNGDPVGGADDQAAGGVDNDQAAGGADNDQLAGGADNDQAASGADNGGGVLNAHIGIGVNEEGEQVEHVAVDADMGQQSVGDANNGNEVVGDAHNEVGVNVEGVQAEQNVVDNKFPISDEVVRRFSPALKMTLFVCKLMEYLYTTKFMSEHTLTTKTGNNGAKKEPLNPADVIEIIHVTRGRFPVTERDPGLRQMAILKQENDIKQTIRVKLNNEAGKAKPKKST